MAKLPSTERTEVFTLRISKKEKEQLNELSKKGIYGSTASEVVRALIKRAQSRR